MLHSMAGRELKSNRELLQITKEYVANINVLHGKVVSDSFSLQEEVDVILANKEEHWWDRLVTLMLDKEHWEAKRLNAGLYVLKEMCLRSREQGELFDLLERLHSLDQLREIYHKTVFYMRRMELDMEDEECMVIWDWIEMHQLPVTYLSTVIEIGDIYDKEKVRKRLMLLLDRYEGTGKCDG